LRSIGKRKGDSLIRTALRESRNIQAVHLELAYYVARHIPVLDHDRGMTKLLKWATTRYRTLGNSDRSNICKLAFQKAGD
jgi:hypothetical protein